MWVDEKSGVRSRYTQATSILNVCSWVQRNQRCRTGSSVDLVGRAGEALVGEGCPQPLPTAVWRHATSQGLPNQSSGFVFPGQHFQCTSPPGNPLPLVEKQSRPGSEHFLLDQNPSHAPWFPNGSGSVARLRADIANLGSVLGDCVTVDSRA